jgi:hypothetical protein
MKYKVVWIQRVLDQITAFCNKAIESGRQTSDITQATAQIDKLLAHSPGQAGESRAGAERILFEPPLSIHFEIHDEERIVVVLSARYLPRRV